MATLTLARQLGGSIGTAVFGWLLITTSGSTHAITTVFAAAALVLVAALAIAPRRRDEPASGAKFSDRPSHARYSFSSEEP